MDTNFDVGSPQAAKRWSLSLAKDTEKQMYFSRFIGNDENALIHRKVELEDDAGDTIKFDLSMRLRGDVVEGDDNVEGTEENLTFYQDQVLIDQARKGAAAGGRMTRKRTVHDLRKIAKDRTATFLAEWFDELAFTYLSGTLAGVNGDRKITRAFAGNPVQAPDRYHQVYGGAATSKATLTAADTMTRGLIERISVLPGMMNSVNPDVVKMSPVNIESGKHFVLLMSKWQSHSLRTEKGELSWSDVQKAATSSEGRSNPLFKGALGLVNDVVLHDHSDVRLFNDYGAGSNVSAARALFMGRQAGVIAYGQAGSSGQRFTWVEEEKDAKNKVNIYAGTICGMKKTRFNGYDFGVVAVDTAAPNPNPAV